MALDIRNYVFSFDYWKQIRKYVKDHPGKYPVGILSSDEELTKYLRSLNQKLRLEDVPGNYRDQNNRKTHQTERKIPNEPDTFRKFINLIYNNPPSTIDRTNALRLCFALEVGSDREANNLLRNYLGMSELSIRDLREFIVTFALRNNLRWTDVFSLLGEYNQLLDKMPASPSDLNSGKTVDVYEKELAGITTVEALKNYLNNPEQAAFFARTRNTLYLALFDDIFLRYYKNTFSLSENNIFLSEELEKLKAEKDKLPPDSPLRALISEAEDYPINLYHEHLFGLHSNEDSPEDSRQTYNYLTAEEIETLAKIYPDTFLTYGNFTSLVRRTRNLDISAGTYVLHLLVTLASDDINYRERDEFVEYGLNYSLFDVGFPALNSENSFQNLVVDTYDDVLWQCTVNDSGKKIRMEYLYQLRGYLKEIAAYVKQTDAKQTVQRKTR